MAKIEITLPDEITTALSNLADKTDTILPHVLEAGGEVVLAKAKSNLAAAVGHGTQYPSRSTGELERSLGLSPAKVDNDGVWNVKVGFSEPRSDGESNAKIATILEYGKHNQPPRPFLKPAKSQTRKASIAAMKAAFDSEMDNH